MLPLHNPWGRAPGPGQSLEVLRGFQVRSSKGAHPTARSGVGDGSRWCPGAVHRCDQLSDLVAGVLLTGLSRS